MPRATNITASSKWWLIELASVVDPISLDPIRLLKYPPFNLPSNLDSENSGSAAPNDWYDGALLASYLVSTGNFTHPISRRELMLSECEALDRYLQEHHLRGGSVALAHARKEDYASGNPPPGSQLATLRAEADMILQSLFAGASARRTERASAPRREVVSVSEGNMSLVDDDELPVHATSAADTYEAYEAAVAAEELAAAAAATSATDLAAAEAAGGARRGDPSERFPALNAMSAPHRVPARESFPSLGDAPMSAPDGRPPPHPPAVRQQRLPAPGVRNAWGLTQPDTYHGGGDRHGGGPSGRPRPHPAPTPCLSLSASIGGPYVYMFWPCL